MRVVCDQQGLGIEVPGLRGPEVIYLAGKPEQDFAMGALDADKQSGDIAGFDPLDERIGGGLPRQEAEDHGISSEGAGE